ncbi:ClbS/DfsB family four-helix bundle protein [Gorillibacterium sp. CAU 1737]|uniref:ClbS/DfsB family four-helix bundle protein n=1 Tax=Gorillibacterium sp. CAU 1737 TaxID=3140362 RepID=UPI00326173A4
MASYEYSSKKELLEAIHEQYRLLDAEFEGIDNEQKDLQVPEVDKTPAEIISYQLGWLALVQGWDADEQAGSPVVMPAPGFKWNQLGALTQSFTERYAAFSLDELRAQFREAEQRWCEWIDTLSEDELFRQGHRQWTGTKENWPMARWIHINSVAPFKNFRAKLRKWKKAISTR